MVKKNTKRRNYLRNHRKKLTFVCSTCTCMLILNIETSTDACSAAITSHGQVLSVNGEPLVRLQTMQSEHARQLPLYIDELLSKLRLTGQSVEAVAVSGGPGSYTGLRIGASTAKGLAYGLHVPLVAIPTLQVMAAAAKDYLDGEQSPKDKTGNLLLVPMIDARRMEVYTACYTTELQEQKDPYAEVICENSFIKELNRGKTVFFGNGMPKCKTLLEKHSNAVFIDNIVPDAAYMGLLAEDRLAEGKVEDIAYWTPFYLKEFEAKHSVVKGL